MSTPDTTVLRARSLADTLVDEEDWEIEPPARRLPWLTLALAGAAVAALAFVGGILVQQQWAPPPRLPASTSPRGFLAPRLGARPAGGVDRRAPQARASRA